MDARIILKRLLSPRLANGHPWVYDNEIERIEGDITPGDTVDVFSFSRQWIGRGYVNPNSKIVARILTRRNERIDRDFFFKRIAEAIDYRNAITPRSTVRRLVFGEGDDLSGLIIDRLEDVFVFQFNTAGMHRFRSEIIDAVRERFPEGFFYDKSDPIALAKEQVTPLNGWIGREFPEPFSVSYQGLRFSVSPSEGQKTGIYIDQLENAVIAASLCFPAGKVVWDVFSNSGNFGLRMLQNGAKRVAFVDQSATAIADCRENLRLNALSGASFHEGNAFDILRAWEESNEKADIIVLDPPSFTKSRSTKGNALRGYKEINLRALKALRRGGYLVSASCSQAVSRQEFEMMMYSAATDVGARLRLVYRGGQPADHPVVLNIFETDYLKFYIFEKLS